MRYARMQLMFGRRRPTLGLRPTMAPMPHTHIQEVQAHQDRDGACGDREAAANLTVCLTKER